MSAIEVLLAIAGVSVTALVVAGMILLTPRGQVPVHADGDDPQGSQPSAAPASRSVPMAREAVRRRSQLS